MIEKTLLFSLYSENICFVSLHFNHLLIIHNIGNILLLPHELLVYWGKFVVSYGKCMALLEKKKQKNKKNPLCITPKNNSFHEKTVCPILVLQEKMQKEILVAALLFTCLSKTCVWQTWTLLLLWADIEIWCVFMVIFLFRFQKISRYYKVLFLYYLYYLKESSIPTVAFESPEHKKARSLLTVIEMQMKTEALWTLKKFVSQHFIYLCLRLWYFSLY